MPRGGSTWESRRTRLCAPLYAPEVHRAVSALSEFVARHDAVPRLLQRQLPREACEERNLGALLDCALSILWHSQSVPRNTFVEQLCRRAVPDLRELSQHALSERDFTSLSTLQHGATGTVEVVRCKFDRHLYVLKSILKGVARRESYRFSPVFESQLLGFASDEPYTPKLHAAFQGPGSVHIVMEYFPAGDLDSLLRAAAEAGSGYPGKSTQGGLLQEDWVVRYAADMVAAIGWLHRLQFVHRSGRLKLCDFATCAPFALFGEERRVLAFYTQRPAGTCDYIAPEILKCEEQRILAECPSPPSTSLPGFLETPAPDALIPGAYGPGVDWWSLGVVLYEMVFGKPPFWAPMPADVYAKIASHEQHFAMDSNVPCSAALRALIAALVCSSPQRLGQHATEQVQHHAVFSHVPWDALDTYAVPFVPSHAAAHQADASGLMPSVLHSPLLTPPLNGGESVSMDTPPSFSQMYQGPLELFPTFPDSLDAIHTPAAASHPPHLLEVSPADSWPSSTESTPNHTSQDRDAGWNEIDTHFQGFSLVPNSNAFAADGESEPAQEVQSASPSTQPLASTPMTKPSGRPPVSPPGWQASPPDAQPSLQRRAVQTALRIRNGPNEIHTPFRLPSLGPPVEPVSPYPFPLASGARATVIATPGFSLSPEIAMKTPGGAYETMGSDSRHSGGSTWKRNLSERQAWTEMMDAVQRSARKLDAGHFRPETSLRSLAEEEEESLPPLPSQSSISSRRPSLRVHSPTLLEQESPEKRPAPALRTAASCFDLRRRMLPLETSVNANQLETSPQERPMLRTRRSTRQLLLDAQVTSTPTRSASRIFSLPSPQKAMLDSRTTSSPPRRRTLKGSASVRDFREVIRQEKTLPTLPDASPPPAQRMRAQRDEQNVWPPMDSHRTLSEYRRGLAHGRSPAPRAEPGAEDAFGRAASLQRPTLRSWDRAARRMQSSLGLSSVYRQGNTDASKENVLQRMTTEHRDIQRSVTSLERELKDLKHRVDHVEL